MSSKAARSSKLQADLERNREDGNWRKVIELAETLRSQNISGQESQLATLLLGEGKLELYLEDHPPLPANFQSAKTGLGEARNMLNQCVGDQDKKMTVSLDALLLLAKLEYATGDYNAALSRLNNAGLDKLQEKALTTRSLKIVAESFAIKGLCLEQTTLNRTSRYKKADKLAKTVRCFELASDLTLVYLQRQHDKITSTPSTTSLPSLSTSTNTGGSSSPLPPFGTGEAPDNRKVGAILEGSLQRAPLLHLRAGNLQQAIDRHRLLLSAIECSGSQQLRLVVSTQLAELLLSAVSSSSYSPPALPGMVASSDGRVHKSSTGSGSGLSGGGGSTNGMTASASFSEGAWKPRRYAGTNLFVPTTRTEEIILLLLISEAMAVKDAVLTQCPEFAVLRERANTAATAIHDMLALALAPSRNYQILIEVYERSMKFSWGCGHVWRQFGLTLICGRQPARGVRVLKEAHRLQPTNAVTCLMAAKVAFQSLAQIDEGIEWVKKAQQALELSSTSSASPNANTSADSLACPALLTSQQLLARCLLFHAIGLVLKAQQATVYCKALTLRKEAMQLLIRASELDPGDHLCHFYLSEGYAWCRQLSEAGQSVRASLGRRPDHLPSLLLLLLLLDAQGETEEALQLVTGIQREYPSSLQVVSVVVALQERQRGPRAALQTASHMMALWHALYNQQVSGESDAAEVASGHTTTQHDAHSMFNLSEDNDNASVCGAAGAESVSRVEFALSEVASSVSGSHCPKPGPQQAWAHQIHCWLTTARLYLQLEQTSEAAQCIQEAAAIFPMNHQIMFMKGQVYENKGELVEAQSCYENALAVNPYHTTSLRHLGIVYQQQGSNRLAEKTLLDAVKIDPLDHHSWCALGEVTHSLGELDRSSDCLLTALDLQRTAPAMPFASLLPCFS